MWSYMDGRVDPDVSDDCIAFICRMKCSKKSSYIPLPWRRRHSDPSGHQKQLAHRHPRLRESWATLWEPQISHFWISYVFPFNTNFKNLVMRYFRGDIKVGEIFLSLFLSLCSFHFRKRQYFILWKCIAENGKRTTINMFQDKNKSS